MAYVSGATKVDPNLAVKFTTSDTLNLESSRSNLGVVNFSEESPGGWQMNRSGRERSSHSLQ